MRYRVTHRTAYNYPQPIFRGYNEARLAPRETAAQRVHSHAVTISPLPAYRSERTDYFGNRVLHFALQQSHRELVVTAVSDVELVECTSELGLGSAWEDAVSATRGDLSATGLDAQQYLLDSPLVTARDDIAEYARTSFPAGRPLTEAVRDLMARIHRDFTYDPTATTVSTPLERVFQDRRGVCQDFAHLAIAGLRALGLAARYVSGYLETLPPPGQAKLRGADASHAWFSVYDPWLGWLDYDPTNNVVPMTQHITTAWGRDYGDISPLKGIVFGGGRGQRSTVSVDVERLDN